MQSVNKLTEFAHRLRERIRIVPEEKSWSDEVFAHLALELFTIQYEQNEAYRRLCGTRFQSRDAQDWTQIPAVPTSAFKDWELTCLAPESRTSVFYSSGTTGQRPSRHFHSNESLALYEESLMAGWRRVKGSKSGPQKWFFLAPPASQAPHSSLVHMFETFRRQINSDSGFLGRLGPDNAWMINSDEAAAAIQASISADEILGIFGTAFSFVHLLDFLTERGHHFKLPADSFVMETGGYKGRSRNLPKEELHQLLCERLGILPPDIICEYGMSELSSQAYDNNPEGIASFSPGLESLRAYTGWDALSVQNPERVASDIHHSSFHGQPLPSATTRIFHFPPWARVQIISPETAREVSEGETGLIRIFDLANVFSVMAIQTEDLAVKRGDGFELLGRATFAEPRGCSLMAV